jgi:hypothetical protein
MCKSDYVPERCKVQNMRSSQDSAIAQAVSCPQGTGFIPRPIHVGFVANKVYAVDLRIYGQQTDVGSTYPIIMV